MARKLLLSFKEKPSFEGELSVALMEEHDPEGHAKYFLVCQKEPPFNTEEIVLIAGAREGFVDDQRDELMKSISWQREVPAAEANEILDILQHQIASIVPEATIGLDGTIYELLIERGFSKVQFTWWCDPPLGWKGLGEVARKVLSRTASISALESLQTNRKQSIKHLRDKLDELHARRKRENEELIRMHNRRCQELASSLKIEGLTCPACNYHSKDIRFVDRSPEAKSYFICSACGRSFRPEELPPVHT